MNAISSLPHRDGALALREALLAGLRDGRWHPGERLPTERALAAHAGVGRTVVRRVLAGLRDAGLIHQAVGRGTFVADDIRERLHPAAALPISPAELMEARERIEPMRVELAVTRATAADFDAMETCCARAEAAATLADFEHWDAALHDRIARASHNGFFVAVFQLVNDVRDRGEWGVLKQRSMTPQRRAEYQREHRALVAALKSRDATLARERITTHLQRVRRNLLGTD